MNKNNINDIIIIGAGAAGMTAALYSLRSGKSVLLLEQESFGGQIASSPRVENYPSIKSMSGAEFSDNLFDQIDELGVEWELDTITNIDKKSDYFVVKSETAEYLGKAVILAIGVKHKHINVKDEEKFEGNGLSYCAVCDGPYFKGKEVAVIGDANTALQYTLLLSNYCKKVYICTLFDKFFGDKMLVDRLPEVKNVDVIHDIALTGLKGDKDLDGLVFENTKTKKKVSLDVDGVFIAIGQEANSQDFENLVDLTKEGFIKVDQNCQTKTKGLYACGDCVDKDIRQLTTAVSDGSIAAIKAVYYIDNDKK